jgi:hypothetical protein
VCRFEAEALKKGGNGFGTSAQLSSENMLDQGEGKGKV